MEELRSSAFPKRGSETNDAATSRIMWRRLHPERRAPEADIHAGLHGPYETSYEITHGYTNDRPITRP
jgi:hypothetical protein